MSANPLEMSDEEFSKLTSPEALKEAEEEENKASEEPEKEEPASDSNENAEEKEEEAADDSSEKEEESESEEEKEPKEKPKDQPKKAGKPLGSLSELDKKADKPDNSEKNKSTIPSEKPSNNIDYKAFYEKVMAPLKANGKTLQLKNPEEAIQLMQMGANYTKKMQSIAPYRKVITMLESNGLLDEDKLSFLIDIDKKNPEAIKKLVKDAGIDPLEMDVSEEPKYVAGTHRVTDREVAFRAVLDDLQTNEGGMDTIRTINTTWDEQSKNILWEQPEIMQYINEQQRSGVYKLICDEMDRKRMLGQIPNGMPFLQAYKLVGDSLLEERQKQNAASVQPIATRTMQKPSKQQADKAKSASLPRSTPKTAKKFINPLAMSDEDFLKQMANRF